MRRLASILAASAVLLHPATGPRAELRAQEPALLSDSAIREIIKGRVEAQTAAGIVVGVIEPDGRRRVVSYGASGTARPLDANSVFEIGSITKTFTAAVLAEMARRGEVRLDDPVAKYLPASVTVPSRNGRQITLVDLATQSSGLPRMPTNFSPKDQSNPYADFTPELLYAFLSSYQLQRDVGAEYEYSNLGVGLLGHALTLRAKADLETTYRRYLLDPLGMKDTRVALAPSMRERLALGHNEAGNVVPNWDVAALGGAGALRSTANDMLAYLAANMAADADSVRGPLAPALHATHVRRRDAGPGGIGLAWHIRPTPAGGSIVWHNGGTGGYRTFAGYDPARRVGVVVLTNSSGAGHDDIGFHLLAPALALRPPTRPAWVGRKEVALPATVLDRYVGEYQLTPAFSLVVTREGDGLVTQATGQGKIRIFAESETEFYPRVVDARITFQVDDGGKVTGLTLHQNGRDMPAAKVK
ncbi:MAG TPA: serine hydrolase [Gemmatimonadaceae bacterium]|nr:serine hydrolase [Gemmatimonadaceae bacterium]